MTTVKELTTPGRTMVMGILNVTEDSFSDGGKWLDRDAAIGAEGESAQQLLNNDLVNGTTAATSGRIAYVVPENWYLAFCGLTATAAVYAEVAALVE